MNTVYLPHVSRDAKTPYKGVAMAVPNAADLQTLGAEWWYNWGPLPTVETTIEFVPMLWGGQLQPEISRDYSGPLLVFNEPNVEAQLNLSPAAALVLLRNVRMRYPFARLIGPGHSCWAAEWMREFIRIGGKFDAWAIHAYLEGELGVEHIREMVSKCHDMTGGQYWVTEYGDTRARGDDFADLTAWFGEQPWIERISAYTNRQPHQGLSWEISENVELVDGRGRLKRLGEVYAGKGKR